MEDVAARDPESPPPELDQFNEPVAKSKKNQQFNLSLQKAALSHDAKKTPTPSRFAPNQGAQENDLVDVSSANEEEKKEDALKPQESKKGCELTEQDDKPEEENDDGQQQS